MVIVGLVRFEDANYERFLRANLEKFTCDNQAELEKLKIDIGARL